MKNKYLILLGLTLGLALCMTNTASATYTEYGVVFTADNVVNLWQLEWNGGVEDGTVLKDETWSDWKTPFGWVIGSYTDFSIVWEVQNSGTPGSGNPGGFLSEIVLLNDGDILPETLYSSASWWVSTNRSDWYSATEYGGNGEEGVIWTNVNGGPISGISSDAQWIWWEDNFENSPETVFVKVDLASASPVPEPATIVLLGIGLLGLARLTRKNNP